MKFTELIEEAKLLWPSEISVSDGVLGKSDSAKFPEMALIQVQIEQQAPSISVWQDLFTWSVYVGFHSLAKSKLKNGDLSPAKFSDIDWPMVESHLSGTLYSKDNSWPDYMKEQYENDLEL